MEIELRKPEINGKQKKKKDKVRELKEWGVKKSIKSPHCKIKCQ